MREAYYERERVAQRDLGTTNISPGLAGILVGLFLVSIVATPAMDVGKLWRQPGRFDLSEIRNRVAKEPSLWNQLNEANQYLANRAATIEQQMSTQLWPVSFFQPLQAACVRMTGLNTRSVIAGNDQWLFYKPDIEHLIGPGFLDSTETTITKRYADLGHPQDNPTRHGAAPIDVIVDFQKQLERRGIDLVVLPIPVKPSIHPERLSQRYSSEIARPLSNRSFEQFRMSLENAGVNVLDIGPLLLSVARSEASGAFLKTDTHWTPEAVVQVAEFLADWAKENGPHLSLQQEFQTATLWHLGQGDLSVILSGLSGSRWYPPERVERRQVMTADGQPWQPSHGEILLLGDSFTNIYSMPELNFGEFAGLAEQVSYAFQRPVDRIALNNNGAIATRRDFARALAQQPQRFAQTKLVIWQFSTRELSFGNWLPIQLPEVNMNEVTDSQTVPQLEHLFQSAEMVDVRIVSMGTLAVPTQLPYPDALLALEGIIEGANTDAAPVRCVIYVWGKRDNQLLPASRLQIGQRVNLRLIKWDEVEEQLGRFSRAELDDPNFERLELPVFFGELRE